MRLDPPVKRVLFLMVALMAGIPLFLVGLYSNVDSIIFYSKAVHGEDLITNVRAQRTNFPWGTSYTYDYGVDFAVAGKTEHVLAVSGRRYDRRAVGAIDLQSHRCPPESTTPAVIGS